MLFWPLFANDTAKAVNDIEAVGPTKKPRPSLGCIYPNAMPICIKETAGPLCAGAWCGRAHALTWTTKLTIGTNPDDSRHMRNDSLNQSATVGRQSRSNWSPPIVSAKREFFGNGLETFRYSALEI